MEVVCAIRLYKAHEYLVSSTLSVGDRTKERLRFSFAFLEVFPSAVWTEANGSCMSHPPTLLNQLVLQQARGATSVEAFVLLGANLSRPVLTRQGV